MTRPPAGRGRGAGLLARASLLSGLSLLPTAALAQVGVIREIQTQALATFAARDFVGGGLGLGYRPVGRLGFSAMAVVGREAGAAAGRGEVVVLARLNPYRVRGVAPYGLAGVAVHLSQGDAEGYIVLGLGLEGRPAARAGWFLEGGLGGGVRVSAGIRLRRMGPPVRR